ncbi:MAG: putative membrane protein [Dokdonia sp.]|jgi:uncharacterized membrane protein
MTQYKEESHARSLLKGIVWRIIATGDTILLVLVFTCLSGVCSTEDALAIAGIDFIIKLVLYYLHERLWQKRREIIVSKKETLYKSISWRIIATAILFVISGVVLESYSGIALFIAVAELITKFVLYYFHERLWLRLPLGYFRNRIFKKF